MRLRPDFERTATGYVFLDFLTLPYWRFKSRRAFRRFEKAYSKTWGYPLPRKDDRKVEGQ